MDAMLRWIGGTTALIGLAVGGFALSARNPSPAPSPDPAPAEREFAAEAVAPNTDAPTAEPAPAAESAAADSLVIKRVLPIKGPIRYGEWHWDEAGVPDGPLIMTVDLDARVLSVFRGGYEIGATAVMLGTQEHPTPLGSFPILTKERHNVSEKYNNAPMPWTLRLTWDGIAIHGGAEVENGYASHGCIGTPDPFAAKLFAAASKGDRVIITRGKRIGTGDALI